MTRTLLTALSLLTLPSLAVAAPLVVFHVPDGATSTVDGADIVLDDERDAVTRGEVEVDQLRAKKEDAKALRRDARHERRVERRQLRQARRDLRKAERKQDEAGALFARARLREEARDLTDAIDHVGWHNAEIETTKAELRAARAERSLAKAELEAEQARLLEDRGSGIAPLLPPSVFEGQAKRIENRATLREAEAEVEETESDDAHEDYVASAD